MGIYFGNLDRQLADRQQVLKEDAERQYRGMRDIRESFGGFGDAVTDVIKSDSELEKLRYDLQRQTEYDIRQEEQHKDLRLSKRLNNIEGLNRINLADHTLKQWPRGTPKAVRKIYDERIDQHTKQSANITDPYQRILAFPALYGTEALKAAKRVATLVEMGDEDGAAKARADLPQAPLGFMKWAEEQKYFDSSVTGNPLAHGNAMYRHALYEAGYNIPNPDSPEYNLNSSKGGTKYAGAKAEVGKDAKPLAALMNKMDEEFLDNEDKAKRTNPADQITFNQPETIEEIEGKIEEARTSQESILKNRAGIGQYDIFEKDKSNFTEVEEEVLEEIPNPEEAVEKGNPFVADILNSTADFMYKHSISKAVGKDGGVKAINKAVIPERNKVVKIDPILTQEEGPETTLSTQDIDKYKNLPNYETWEDIPESEKKKLKEDTLVKLGASVKDAANYRKVQQEAIDNEDEILLLHNEIASRIEASPSIKKLHGGLNNLKDHSEAPIKLEEIKSSYGGMIGAPTEINRLIKNYNNIVPTLKSNSNELRGRMRVLFRTDVPKPGAKKEYTGRDWGKPSVIKEGVPIPDWYKNIGKAPVINTASRMLNQEQQDISKEARMVILEKEGYGKEGHAYFDGGAGSTKSGDYVAIDPKTKKGSENLVLPGGNNIYDTINSITNKREREDAIKDISFRLFGVGSGQQPVFGSDQEDINEFIDFLNSDKKDHKYLYATHEDRGKLKLNARQTGVLTDYMLENHLERLQKKHEYLYEIATYPKEMQLFIMDNAFNMGPGWLEKFDKLEGHLKKWHDTRSDSDLKKIMDEYKDSDHFRNSLSRNRALSNWKRLQSLRTTTNIT